MQESIGSDRLVKTMIFGAMKPVNFQIAAANRW